MPTEPCERSRVIRIVRGLMTRGTECLFIADIQGKTITHHSLENVKTPEGGKCVPAGLV